MGDRSKLKELFLAACQMPAAERVTFLDEQCGEDSELRAELDALLRVEDEAPDFLKQPAGVPATLVKALQHEGSALESVGKLVRQSNAAARFVHVGELAEGGMGKILEVVDTDLRRSMVMKVIRGQTGARATGESPGVAPLTMSRFLEEAHVMGQLEHPGVVPVLVLGADEESRSSASFRRGSGSRRCARRSGRSGLTGPQGATGPGPRMRS